MIKDFSRVKRLTRKILPSYGNNVVDLGYPINLIDSVPLPSEYTLLSTRRYIKDLKAHAVITSVEEVEPANFLPEDSETEKVKKAMAIEWGSQRKHLTLLENDGTNGWVKMGMISLLNPSGYPYRNHTLQDLYTDGLLLELGDNAKIGLRVDDAGWGFLDDNDYIHLRWVYLEEYTVDIPDKTVIINNYGGGGITQPTSINWDNITESQWQNITESQWQAL